MKKLLSVLAVAACAGLAQGQLNIVVPTSNSVGPLGTATNGVTLAPYAGPSTIFSSLNISGSLTEVNTGTWASEARWNIRNTAFAVGVNYQSSIIQNFTGTLAINANFSLLQWANTGDIFRAESFESFDDAGTDARWDNTTLAFSNTPTITTLGPYAAGPFDINTFTSAFDTELALYTASGTLLASNDDTGGLQSQILTPLGNGSYYLVLGGYDSQFASGVALAGAATGAFNLNINGGLAASGTLAAGELKVYRFEVPAPGALGLAGFGLLALARRRR